MLKSCARSVTSTNGSLAARTLVLERGLADSGRDAWRTMPYSGCDSRTMPYSMGCAARAAATAAVGRPVVPGRDALCGRGLSGGCGRRLLASVERASAAAAAELIAATAPAPSTAVTSGACLGLSPVSAAANALASSGAVAGRCAGWYVGNAYAGSGGANATGTGVVAGVVCMCRSTLAAPPLPKSIACQPFAIKASSCRPALALCIAAIWRWVAASAELSLPTSSRIRAYAAWSTA